MRYSRMKRGKSQRRYALAIIAIFIIFISIYFIVAGTMGKVISNIISPILGTDKNPKNTEQEDPNKKDPEDEDTEFKLPGNNGQNGNAPRITETIKVEALNFFAIQLGAFNNMENALTIAKQLKTQSAAGYIMEDKFFRVIAIVFSNQEDALVVKQQLEAQSVESRVHELNCPGVDMEITASSEKVEGVKSSFLLLKEKFELMESVIKDLDKDKITPEIAIGRIGETKEVFMAKIEQLEQYSATQEGGQVLLGLKDLFSGQITNLDAIIQESLSAKVEISSKIKYTYIDMVIRYKEYIEKITQG